MNTAAIVFGVIFLVAGVIAGWFMAKFRYSGASDEKIMERDKQIMELKSENSAKSAEIQGLLAKSAAGEADIRNLNDRLSIQKKETEEMFARMKTEFENISKTVLEDRRNEFLKTNKNELSNILTPIREKFEEFKSTIDKNYNESTKEQSALKGEIATLVQLNKTLAKEADELAGAIKGESKVMGDWGEEQLEKLLQNVGFKKDEHYKMRETFTEQEEKNGKVENKRKQPDCILELPDNRCLVIDSKVSLKDYADYFSAAEEAKRKEAMGKHLTSIKQHVKELSAKRYEKIHAINAPDYVLMFVPVEGAIALAESQEKG
ncbi:MAG TPA: DNA recombination protein RmuC, partial [Candidatus Goldiibacteriota bacterium]|nr:DNA recombination protein RmuC [Candidatus Goldiibacteriota bacterium]